jgi:integrase
MAGKRHGSGDGTIYKRADGRWMAQVTFPDRTRKTVYGKKRVEAARKLTALRRALEMGMSVQRDERMPFALYLADKEKKPLRSGF